MSCHLLFFVETNQTVCYIDFYELKLVFCPVSSWFSHVQIHLMVSLPDKGASSKTLLQFFKSMRMDKKYIV